MKRSSIVRHFAIGAIGVGLGIASTARASPVFTAGTQASLPLAVPSFTSYTFAMVCNPLIGINSMGLIDVCRDDAGPCVKVQFTTFTGYAHRPFNVAGTYTFTYRPDTDPCQLQLPGTGGLPSPLTAVDMANEWTSCDEIATTLRRSRFLYNTCPPTLSPFFVFFLNPATLSPPGGAAIGANEFYKFDAPY